MFKHLFNTTIGIILLIGVYKSNLPITVIFFIVFIILISCISSILFKISLKKDMDMTIKELIAHQGSPISSEKLFLLYKSKNNSKLMTKLKENAILHKYSKFYVIELYGYAKKIFIDNIIVTDLPPKTDLGIRTGKYNFYFKRTQPMIDLMH